MNELLQKLIEILGLPSDSTPDQILIEVQKWKEKVGAFDQAKPDMIAALIVRAIREKKLNDNEREWFANFASEDYLVAQSFLKLRGKAYPSLLAAIQRAKPAAPISDLQAEINAQIGISTEVFLKFNP